MNKLFVVFVAVFLMNYATFAQNNTWIFPNGDGQGNGNASAMVDWNTNTPPTMSNLPTIDPVSGSTYTDPLEGYVPNPDHMHGGAANIIKDANGHLLFFIVGSSIFDRNGRTIYTNPNSGDRVSMGHTEICVVPDPTDCNRYYIFNDNYNGGSAGGKAIYTILDITKTPNSNTPFNPDAQGALVHFNGTLNSNSVPFSYLEQPPLGAQLKSNEVCFAASQIDANGNRKLFVLDHRNYNSLPTRLLVYNIGQTGIQQIASYSFIRHFKTRSELEVFEMSDGTYKLILAHSLGALLRQIIIDPSTPNNVPLIQDIHIGDPLISQNPNDPSQIISEYVPVSGIEIVGDEGRYVYFTHRPSSTLGNVIDCWDTQTNSFVSLPSWASSTIDNEYQFSFIEAQNGKLYLPIHNKLAEIGNITTPQASTFNPSFLGIDYVANYFHTLIAPEHKRYTLQDQIDGDDYGMMVSPSTVTGCTGNFPTICVNNPKPFYTYQWVFNGNIISTGTCFAPTTAGYYTLVAAGDWGCEKRQTIRVIDEGVGVDAPHDITFCSLTQNNPSYVGWTLDPFGQTFYGISWTYTDIDGTTTTIANTGVQYQVPYLGPGMYTAVVNAGGCTETFTINVTDLLQVYTNSPLAHFFSNSVGQGSVSCQPSLNLFGMNDTWTVVDQYGNSVSYFLSSNGITFTPIVGFQYSITLTREMPNQCKKFTYQSIWVTPGKRHIRQNKTQNAIGVAGSMDVKTFPNPTTGLVNVQWTNTEMDYTNIQILNALGQVIVEKEVKGENNIEVDLTKETSGIYLIQVVNGAQQFTKKIIKD